MKHRIISKTEKAKSLFGNNLFHIKNSHFSQSVSLEPYPFPNKIRGIGSYFITYSEIFKIPCLALISSQEEYLIDLNSISLFNKFAQGHSLLKDKLSENHIKSNKINLGLSVFAELDSNSKLIYT
jgi:hypothetical protein